MNKLYSLLAAALLAWPALDAQVVTTSPAIVQTNSTGIVVTFHADEGNKGLMGVKPPTKVYAHTGVITNLSKNDSDWKYGPAKWGDNSAKYELTWVSDNTWELNIGTLNGYYGIKNASETVEKMAFVFRTADNSREGKTASGGDIFIKVYPADEFVMTLTSTAPQILTSTAPQSFTVNTTEKADITLSVGATTFASAQGQTTLTGSYSFAAQGNYIVTAKATVPGTTKTKTEMLSIKATGASREMEYPGGEPVMGPVTNDDGSVTFCIAAPGKETVILRGSWNDYDIIPQSVMNYQDKDGIRYFWKTVTGITTTKNQIYFFNIDGDKNVGDPYARLVLDPWNDNYIPASVFPDRPKYPSTVVSGTPVAVYNSAINDYDWQTTDFKRPDQSDLLIYELLIRDFTGTEGQAKGNGTVAGVIEKLDYLKDLGVNAIELLPIMEFNGNLSWGYNTNFYFAPDKAYGTPADYKRLIDECHARGMAVILDIVFNQSDGLHPWYMMYDIARNPFYNGSAPHSYSVLNDWNQDYPLVQKQWHDALQYWLTEYHVDGFRFDLVKGLGNNDSYKATFHPETNTWTGVTDAKTNAFNASRVARMKELHDAMRAVDPTAYFINENLAGAQEENDMAKDGEINWANINNNSCEFAMGYNENNKSALNRFYAPLDSRTWGSTVSYAESHDEERMAYKQTKYGAAGVKGNIPVSMRRLGTVAAQMLMAPGAHMIWQFQEFGADQTTKNADGGNNTDNKKVIWSYLDNPDRHGLMKDYTTLLWTRRKNPELFREDVTTSVRCTGAAGRTISLRKDSKAIYMVANASVTETVTVDASVDLSAPGYQLMACSYGTTPEASAAGVKLLPGAFAVYGTDGLYNGIDSEIADTASAPLVYGAEGMIVVEGPAEGVQAFTATGAAVPLTGLQPGLYIVRAGDTVTKVIVR